MSLLLGFIDFETYQDAIERFLGKENFENDEKTSKEKKDTSPLVIIYNIINVFIWIYAIYLSFKRNNGFHFGAFLGACCCPPCYIAYSFAVPVTKKENVMQL